MTLIYTREGYTNDFSLELARLLPKRTTSRSSLLACYQRTQELLLTTCYYLLLLCYCVFKPLTLSPPLRGGREGFHFAKPLLLSLLLCYCVLKKTTPCLPLRLRSLLLLSLLLCYCVFKKQHPVFLFAREVFCYYLCYSVTVSLNPILCLPLLRLRTLLLLSSVILLLCL